MIRHSKTYVAAPTGFTIKEMIDDRGISQDQLAARLGKDEAFVRDLIEGDVVLTQEVAENIEKAMDIPAYFLLNLEQLYREDLVKVPEENTKETDRNTKIGKKKEPIGVQVKADSFKLKLGGC